MDPLENSDTLRRQRDAALARAEAAEAALESKESGKNIIRLTPEQRRNLSVNSAALEERMTTPADTLRAALPRLKDIVPDLYYCPRPCGLNWYIEHRESLLTDAEAIRYAIGAMVEAANEEQGHERNLLAAKIDLLERLGIIPPEAP